MHLFDLEPELACGYRGADIRPHFGQRSCSLAALFQVAVLPASDGPQPNVPGAKLLLRRSQQGFALASTQPGALDAVRRGE